MAELSRSGMLDDGSLADWKGSIGPGRWAISARSERCEFRTVHTLIQDISVIWIGRVVVDNTNLGSNYVPETVGSVLPAPFPWTES